LVDYCPPYNLINSINYQLTDRHAFRDSTCTSIPDMISNNYLGISKLLYAPLEEIPLLINNEYNLVKAIAKWRLMRGK